MVNSSDRREFLVAGLDMLSSSVCHKSGFDDFAKIKYPQPDDLEEDWV